jgi:hypothetical protein
VLTNDAQISFDDKDTQYGVTYSYKLRANYNNQAVSRGVDLPPTTPSPKIDSFTITATEITKQAQTKEKIYKVSWNINMPGIDLQILVNEKTVCRLKSDQGSCDLELPPEGFYNITALALSGGKWMNSENSQQLNTYSPCSIDEKASAYYEESGLHLKVDGVIPANVVGFYYAVRTADSPKRFLETLETEDVNASGINRISTEAYRQNGEIRYEKMSRDESAYYVSLFTIYNTGGKEVVSNSKRRRFDRPLNTNVTWKLSKNLLGALKLTVEFSGDRSFGRIPELVLCAGNQHLLTHDDGKAEHLLKIPAIDLEPPQKTYTNSYDLNSGISAKQLKDKKIFLFEVSPAPGEKYTLRWAEGFTGKI